MVSIGHTKPLQRKNKQNAYLQWETLKKTGKINADARLKLLKRTTIKVFRRAIGARYDVVSGAQLSNKQLCFH